MSEKEVDNPRYQERQRKPSGWKGPRGALYWTKSTKYGMEYKCPYCGKVSRGISDRKRMHWNGCPNSEANPWVAWHRHSVDKRKTK